MTARGYEAHLDRLLTREHTVEIEVPATTTYAYDTQELQTGDRVSDGAWRRDSDTELAIGLNDSNGLSFPDLTLPTSGVEVAWDDATATILTITDMVLLRNPFGLPLGIRLTFNATLPAPGTALAIRVSSGGTRTITSTTEQKVWCGLRDFTGRDQINISGSGSFFELSDTRVIVRADGTWDVGDEFTLDGDSYNVRGIARIGGRRQYLELLSRK